MDLLGFFARRGESYLHPYGRPATDVLLDVLALSAPDRILELGCGTGATLVETGLRFPNARIVGVDQRLDMLLQAQRRLRATGVTSVSLVNARIDRSPFNTLWPAAYGESVFGILTPRAWRRAARQVFQVLEPGGVFILNEAVWAPGVTVSQARSLNREMSNRYGLVQALESPLNTKEWTSAFRSVGFKIEQDPICLRSAVRALPPHGTEAEAEGEGEEEGEGVLMKSSRFSKVQTRRGRRSLDLLRAVALRWNEWTLSKRRLPLDSRLFVLRKP